MTDEEVKRMVFEQGVQKSIETLKEWAKTCTGEPTKETRTLLTFHVNKLADAYNDLRKQAAQGRLDAANAEAQTSQQPKTTDSHVTLDWRGDPRDPDTFGRAVVRIQDGDGGDLFPGVALNNSTGPCFEMWPIPIPFVFTLRDLKAVVTVLEENANRLPYEG
jgi:hypothetical protein